jgi:hypothetical protein
MEINGNVSIEGLLFSVEDVGLGWVLDSTSLSVDTFVVGTSKELRTLIIALIEEYCKWNSNVSIPKVSESDIVTSLTSWLETLGTVQYIHRNHKG